MNKKIKLKLGQKISSRLYFSEEEKLQIINDYLSGDETKQSVYKRYTGYKNEHGRLLRWMRELGISNHHPKSTSFVSMSKGKEDKSDFEKLQLEKRIVALEKQLKDAEMQAIAFSTMIDIAEKELKISIRKKYNTKPSKK